LLFLLCCSALFLFSIMFWYEASAANLVTYEIKGDSKICYYGPNGPVLVIRSYETCPRKL
jgi:hypothetical protein